MVIRHHPSLLLACGCTEYVHTDMYDGTRQEHLPSDRAGKSKTAKEAGFSHVSIGLLT